MTGPGGKTVAAVERAGQILRQLAVADDRLGVNEIARALDLVPSTCLNILRTLTQEGLVDFDPASKRYRLGVGIVALARDLLARSDFASEVQPELDRIAARHDVTAIATELDGREHMVAIRLAHARSAMRIHVDVGSRFPALISASGRCFAAHLALPERELRRRFDGLRWQHPPTFDAWLEEVAAARRDGYAVDRNNYIGGVTVVAAAILDGNGRPARGIAAVGLSEQIDDARLAAIAADVRAAARRFQPQA
jgi:DNA-binding IclR family transcriptional regulator